MLGWIGDAFALPLLTRGSSYGPSLVESVRAAVTLPSVRGFAASCIVQLAPGATTVPGSHPAIRLKSAVVTLAVCSVIGALPLLSSVTLCGADAVPIVTLPKSTWRGNEHAYAPCTPVGRPYRHRQPRM